MIFVAIIIAIGLWKKQDKLYWKNAVIAFAIQYLATFLFYRGKGLVAVQLGEDLWYISFICGMILGWVIPIWLVKKAYKMPLPKPSTP